MLESGRLALSSTSRRLPQRKYLTGKSNRPLLAGLLRVPYRTWAAGVHTTYSCHREQLYLSRPLRHHALSSAIITILSTGTRVPSTRLNPIHAPTVVTSAQKILWTH